MTSAEEIKSKLDIVDVINEYVTLKPAGTNFKARCPFHDEKSASFMVSRPKQIWHCFGCGEGGDIFTFVMKQEGVEFPEALRLLGEKAGVHVVQEPVEQKSEREQLLKVMETSVSFWSAVLWESAAAKEARRYLQEERGLLPETIRAWKIGYAPESWDALVSALARRGLTSEDVIKAGVAIRKMEAHGRNAYDRFRNRIMFPIADTHGRVVGVTGRILDTDQRKAPAEGWSASGGKYVNTPETLLYHKGHVLFGLDRAKNEIRKLNVAVIVEGNMDAIASHQAGVTNVVASSGTALTDDQVRLLKRYTERVAFSFDADAAGENATLKGLTSALSAGLTVLLVELPKKADGQRYKDPDECIRANPDLWKQVIAQAQPVLDHYLHKAAQERDLTKLENKQAVVKMLLPIIGKLPDKVASSHYLKQLAELVDVPESYLREAIEKTGSGQRQTPEVKEEGKISPKTVKESPTLLARLSEVLLAALFFDLAQLNFLTESITPDMLSPEYTSLYRECIVYYTEHKTDTPGKTPGKTFLEQFRAYLLRQPEGAALVHSLDVLQLLADKEFLDSTPTEFQRELSTTVKRLKKFHLHKTLQSIEQKLRDVERAGNDPARLTTLLKEFQEVSARIMELDT